MPPRVRAVVRQVVWAFLTLVVLSVVTFFSVNAGRSPDDLATQALGKQASPEARTDYIRTYHLDDPVVLRYERWLSDFATGDLGFSYINQRPVEPDIMPRLWRTLTLAVASLIFAVPVALLVGLYTARRWGTRRETGIGFIVIALNAMPEFVVGISLLVVLASTLHLLPPDSSALAFSGGDHVRAYVLPILTLVLVTSPYMARVTRAAARETLAAPYTRAAIFRGLTRRRILWDYAMRNAAVPIVNAIAINLVYLIGGVIVVENVFSFPGIGQALIQAIAHGDAITVQAIALLLGGIFILISLAADFLVIYLNPRLRVTVKT
jgi:peptide/nickel transport system permease protein